MDTQNDVAVAEEVITVAAEAEVPVPAQAPAELPAEPSAETSTESTAEPGMDASAEAAARPDAASDAAALGGATTRAQAPPATDFKPARHDKDAWLDKIDYEAIAGAIVGQALDPLYAWFEREHNLAESFTDVVRNWLDALDTKVVGRIGAAFGCNPEPPE